VAFAEGAGFKAREPNMQPRERESTKRTQSAKIYFAWGCFRKKIKSLHTKGHSLAHDPDSSTKTAAALSKSIFIL
jgi:hypothetical protein